MQVIKRNEICKCTITTKLEQSRLQFGKIVHLEASDEAHLNAKSAVLTSTLEADKDPVVDGDPLWAGTAALKAHIVLSVT